VTLSNKIKTADGDLPIRRLAFYLLLTNLPIF